MSRHDADLAGVGADDAGTVRTDEASLVLPRQMPLHLRHVLLGNAFCDADDWKGKGGGRRRKWRERRKWMRCKWMRRKWMRSK